LSSQVYLNWGKLIFPVTSSINYGLRLYVNEVHKNLVTERVEQLLREDGFFDFFTSCMLESIFEMIDNMFEFQIFYGDINEL
jgi:hypothetical protein